MQIISAALAFAITMLVLSMVVSTLVETIHRLLGMRERGLYYLLGRFYDNVLGPFRRNPDDLGWHANPILRKDFQDRMSEIRAPVALTATTGTARISYSLLDWRDQPATPGESGVKRFDNFLAALWRGVRENWRGRGLASLSCVEFMTRLGAHPLSDRIVAAARVVAAQQPATPSDQQAETRSDQQAKTPSDLHAIAPVPDPVDMVLQGVAQKFESYCNEATVTFERRARTLSVTVAMVIAFLLHVDAAEIFRTFLRDPAVTAAVIAKQDEVMKAFDESRKEREKQIPAVAPNASELPGLQQAAKDIDSLRHEYEAMKAELKNTESQLAGLGVPIGWTEERKISLFGRPEQPLCESVGKPPREVGKDTQCLSGETRRVRPAQGFGWLVFAGLLLGGLLVGLGGPFWYDMVNSLTIIRNTARGQQTQPTPTPEGPPARGAGGAVETPQPRTPVDAFKAARADWIAAGRPSVR